MMSFLTGRNPPLLIFTISANKVQPLGDNELMIKDDNGWRVYSTLWEMHYLGPVQEETESAAANSKALEKDGQVTIIHKQMH